MRTNFARKEHQDSALALMLIILLLWLWKFRSEDSLIIVVTVCLFLTMLVPSVFYPFTFLWLNLSHYLGILSSFVLLSVIFLLFVTPVGLFRKAAGKDSLLLRKFRKGRESVFVTRNQLLTKENLTNPF